MNNTPFVICYVGPNGAGKDTILGHRDLSLGYRVSTVSALLRAAKADPNSQAGQQIQHCMDNGILVGDDIVMPLVNADITREASPVIANGLPRNPEQAAALLQLLYAGDIAALHVIALDVPDEEIHARAADRAVCEDCGASHTIHGNFNPPHVAGKCNACGGQLVRRKDDDPEVVQKRLDDYHTLTEEGVRLLKSAGVPVYRIYNGNSRPKGEAVMEFNQLLTGLLA